MPERSKAFASTFPQEGQQFLHNQEFLEKKAPLGARRWIVEKITRFLLLIVFVAIGGCAAMPAKQSLGMERNEVGWNKDNGNERLVTAFILQELPEQDAAIGFEIEFPEELRKSALIGVEKEFPTFAGVTIRLTRKAFQGVSPEAGSVSIFVSEGKGFVFSSQEMHSITLFAPDGKPYVIRMLRRLSRAEKDLLYEKIEREFPEQTLPIEGIGKRFHFGKEADMALQVPPTVTLSERGAIQGLGTVRFTPNVFGEVVSKGFAAYRTFSTSPTENSLAVKEEIPVQSTISETSLIGDK